MLHSPFPPPPVTPPAEHPRLMLRKSDIDPVKAGLLRDDFAEASATLDRLTSLVITAKGATPEYGTYDLGEALAVEALAFRALLSGSEADAQKAIAAADLLLSSFTVTGGNMGARWGGHIIFVCSEVYDWCHSFIPDDKKYAWIARCEEIAERYFEMGYPPARQTAISGHGTEAQLLRDLLAFSIAVYDERPDIYIWCAGRIFDEYVPAVEALLGEGAHNQGPAYGSYRWTWLCWAELLLERMTGDGRKIFPCLEKTADWLLYMTRPDGEALRLGDDFNETKEEYNLRAPFCVPFFFAYVLSGRECFLSEFRRGFCPEFLLPRHLGMDFYRESSWGEGIISPVSMIIFGSSVKNKPDAPLPACRYFGSPVCETVFKSGDTLIFMKAGEYWGSNHDHLDTGCFQIFRGAPLLTDSGVYDSYGTPHRRQYLTRTSAHNCITVETPERRNVGFDRPDAAYDGGTRRPASGKEPRDTDVLISDEYRMARVLSHRESDDGCALCADLTPAYAHSCEKVTRRMSYDHPSHTFTVEDEIISFDKKAKKALHLHVQTEPRVSGRTVLIENGKGRAVVTVESPEKITIEKTGGGDRRFVTGGTNFPPLEPFTAEAGWGQIVISSTEEEKRTRFFLRITTEEKE